MKVRQVIFATKHTDEEEVIRVGVVWRNADGTFGFARQKAKTVIDRLDAKPRKYKYFTYVDGEEALLKVINPDNKGKYLRTEKDKDTSNNLLKLPPCPDLNL